MVISVSDLPSHGYQCNVSSINIHPITFKQIVSYNKELSNTYIQKLYRDFNLLKSDIGKDFDELNFYDFDMLMLYKKSISLVSTDELKISLNYNCAHCGLPNKITKDIDDIEYTELDEMIKKIKAIKLNGRSFPIIFPKMKDAMLVIDSLMKFKEDIDEQLFLLLCLTKFNDNPNFIKQSIENTTRDEIVLLDYIYAIYNGCNKYFKVNCGQDRCGKENVISINTLMTDFRGLIKSNCRIDTSKIILS